jgi:aspartyl protease family protein
VAEFIYYTILFLIFFLAFFCYGKKNIRRNLVYLLIWLLIFLVLFTIFSYREVFFNNRIMAQLFPGHAIYNKNNNSISFYAAEDGHFYANLYVNKVKIKFLLDTGASNIMLSKLDAKKANIAIDNLKYNKRYSTANGVVLGSRVNLAHLAIKDRIFYDVKANITNSNQDVSLLGIDFFNLFAKYEFNRYKVTLYY